MRGKRVHFISVIILGLLLGGSLSAEDGANPGAPAPSKKHKFQKSQLTFDESEGTADKRRLLLTTGEDKAVDLDFEVNNRKDAVEVGNPVVVSVEIVKVADKRQIVFKPLKAGESTVTLRDADGNLRLIFTVRVTGSNLLRVAGEVRSLLRDVEGIDIRIVGPKVVIEGEVLVPNDYGRLLSVVQDKNYADFIMNLVTLSPLGLQVTAKRIQDDISAFAPNVKTRVLNGMILLEGAVDDEKIFDQVMKLAFLYVPDLKPGSQLERDPTVQRLGARNLIQPFIKINPRPPRKAAKLVRVTVHFVELSKDYNKVFGFKWMPGFTSDPQITVGQNQAGAAGASTGASFSATISSLIPKLASSQAAGFARVLKTGTVIVRSGDPATLNETTEFPFAQSGQNGQVVSNSKTVGLVLAVTPQIIGQSEDIELTLDLSQTDLVGRAPTTGGAPVTATHKVKTKFYIKSAESAAVAGVTATDVGTDFNKDDPSPGTFDQGTDPLFKLLHSKAYRKQKSQFVIFVTPQIIQDASEGTQDLQRNFRVKVK